MAGASRVVRHRGDPFGPQLTGRDSSPVTYNTSRSWAIRAAIEQQRGFADARSPASRMTAPRHQAAAEHPVQLADPGGRQPWTGWSRGGGRGRAGVALSTVPHAWHSPQRPTHLAVLQPTRRSVGRGFGTGLGVMHPA